MLQDILTAMRTVLDNVDTNCVCKTMATCKAIALKIDSKELLEEVAELIHQRVRVYKYDLHIDRGRGKKIENHVLIVTRFCNPNKTSF